MTLTSPGIFPLPPRVTPGAAPRQSSTNRAAKMSFKINDLRRWHGARFGFRQPRRRRGATAKGLDHVESSRSDGEARHVDDHGAVAEAGRTVEVREE